MAKDKIDHLTEIVKLGFVNLDARIEKGFAAIADDIADLRIELKGDIVRLSEQLTSIEAELKDIKHRLGLLEESVAGIQGFAREIDELRDRIRDIERHLGITKKIAA